MFNKNKNHETVTHALKMFSIRDSKSEVFNTPFFKKSFGEAERDLHRLVNDEKTFPGQYPEDFDLYYLGEYDEGTGKFETLDTPKHIVKAIALKKQSSN